MYVFNENDYMVIPVDFNAFFYSTKEQPKKIRYSRDYSIMGELHKQIVACIYSNKNKILILDMRNIVSYNARLFEDLESFVDSIIFINVGEEGSIRQRLKEDLEMLEWEDESISYGPNLKGKISISSIVDLVNTYRKKEVVNIISNLVEDEKKPILLESSGLYGNYYVDIKKLFLNVEDFYFIIYCLVVIVYPHVISERIDAFVSSSKNGAIIANILGGLLDIKEVHLIGVGPKYSMELGNSIECIKPGKKYAYIFDFMCTGTELKIVSALINSKKGSLVYSAGIARYKKNINFNLIKETDVIINTKELGINYKIFGEQDDYISGNEGER